MMYFGFTAMAFIFLLLIFRLIRYKLTKYNREHFGLSAIFIWLNVSFHKEFDYPNFFFGFILAIGLILLLLFMYGLYFNKRNSNHRPSRH
jgi:apolipoprotein N-acyltransferase